jgi:hypothetical protein
MDDNNKPKSSLLATLPVLAHVGIAFLLWRQLTCGYLALVPLGWFLADLGSGLYHLTLDHLPPSGHAPLRRQAADFQDHHYEPRNFLRGGLAGLLLFPGAPLSVLFAGLAVVLPAPLAALVWSFAVGAGLTQVSHGLAHEPTWWAKPLQAARLILPPAEHGRHHLNSERDYCVLSGWANPLLNWLAGGE